jgi:hypothetical protein
MPGVTSIIDIAAQQANQWIVSRMAQFGFDAQVMGLYIITGHCASTNQAEA